MGHVFVLEFMNGDQIQGSSKHTLADYAQVEHPRSLLLLVTERLFSPVSTPKDTEKLANVKHRCRDTFFLSV